MWCIYANLRTGMRHEARGRAGDVVVRDKLAARTINAQTGKIGGHKRRPRGYRFQISAQLVRALHSYQLLTCSSGEVVTQPRTGRRSPGDVHKQPQKKILSLRCKEAIDRKSVV